MQETTEILVNQKSFINLISSADLMVQAVMLLLLVASIWSWAIIIDKWLQLSKIYKKIRSFEDGFSTSKMEEIFEKIKHSISSPIEHVFVASFSELKRSTSSGNNGASKDVIRHKLNSMMITIKNRDIKSLENNINYLATISSATPFIGLFGTVWGIMHSFQSIAVSKNTSLAVVAPGIAEALFATGLGLIAAIPALIFYNVINSKINDIEHKIENFSMELSAAFNTILERHYQ